MGTMSKRFVAVAAALAAAATLAVAPSGAQPEQSPGQRSQGEPTAPALLDVGAPASTSADQVDAASRVDVDTSLLKPGVARTVSVDVLDDDLEVKLDPIASGAAGWSAWDGSVVSEPDSSATVVRNGDDVAGLVTTPSGVYRIRTTAPGQQVVQVVDQRSFPDSPADGLRPPATADLGISPDQVAEASAAPTASGDVPTTPVIDVLVGYTPSALSKIGGQSAMNSEIALAITTSNTAYADSGIPGRLRLAGSTALSENLTLSNQSLSWLTFSGDGNTGSFTWSVDGVNGVYVYGEDGDDRITVGSSIGPYASGGAGDDIITCSFGGESGAALLGGSGNDRLTGDDTADLLVGGSGRDTLIGGGGSDRFDFNPGHTGLGANADLILGFDGVGTAAGDRIDLADLVAGALTFMGTAAFTGINQVRVLDNGTSTQIDINLAGGAAPEAVILVDDGTATAAAQWRSVDFIL